MPPTPLRSMYRAASRWTRSRSTSAAESCRLGARVGGDVELLGERHGLGDPEPAVEDNDITVEAVAAR
jgi:hypothetical protein